MSANDHAKSLGDLVRDAPCLFNHLTDSHRFHHQNLNDCTPDQLSELWRAIDRRHAAIYLMMEMQERVLEQRIGECPLPTSVDGRCIEGSEFQRKWPGTAAFISNSLRTPRSKRTKARQSRMSSPSFGG